MNKWEFSLVLIMSLLVIQTLWSQLNDKNQTISVNFTHTHKYKISKLLPVYPSKRLIIKAVSLELWDGMCCCQWNSAHYSIRRFYADFPTRTHKYVCIWEKGMFGEFKFYFETSVEVCLGRFAEGVEERERETSGEKGMERPWHAVDKWKGHCPQPQWASSILFIHGFLSTALIKI